MKSETIRAVIRASFRPQNKTESLDNAGELGFHTRTLHGRHRIPLSCDFLPFSRRVEENIFPEVRNFTLGGQTFEVEKKNRLTKRIKIDKIYLLFGLAINLRVLNREAGHLSFFAPAFFTFCAPWSASMDLPLNVACYPGAPLIHQQFCQAARAKPVSRPICLLLNWFANQFFGVAGRETCEKRKASQSAVSIPHWVILLQLIKFTSQRQHRKREKRKEENQAKKKVWTMRLQPYDSRGASWLYE